MTVQTQSFTTVVNNAVTAVQGAASALVDTAIGSIIRSLIEAMAAIVMWLQGLLLQVAALTRLATSSNTDVDSFGADFGFTRLPAYASSGQVTFYRATPTLQAFIPAATAPGTLTNGQTNWTGGTLVQSADGTQQFMVIPDTTQAAYSATLNGYIIGAGVNSAVATVQAVTPGAGSNVLAAAISTIVGSVAYVDTVTNVAGFTNGAAPETDAAFKVRFVSWVAALSKATPAAIASAVTSIQAGASCTIVEDYTYGGVYQPGYFYVIADNGTGSPPGSFLTSVSNVVNSVRPIGTTFGVFAPTVVTANVGMTLTTATGYTHSAVVTTVIAALTAYLNGLALGVSVPYTRLAQIAYDASPGVTNVTAVTLNSGTSDLTVTSQQVVKAGTLTVS